MVHLGLPANAHVWWQGYGGMKLNGLIPKIKLLMAVNKTKPDIIIVHVGGNDIGRRPILDVMREYKQTLDELFTLLPGVKVGGSQIMPRTAWRYSTDLAAMSKSRRRLNAYFKNLILNQGGFYVHHNISQEHLAPDGVHLTPIGNDILINAYASNLAQAI